MIVLEKSIKGVTSFIAESEGPFTVYQQDHLQDWKFVAQSKKQAQVRHDFGFINRSVSGVRGFEFLKDSPGTDYRYLYVREEFGKENGWKMKDMTNLRAKLPFHLAHLVVQFAVRFSVIMAFIYKYFSCTLSIKKSLKGHQVFGSFPSFMISSL